MEFNKAYTAVHNMICQSEALLALRDHLEKAKKVEDFLEDFKETKQTIQQEISDLEGYRNKLVQDISDSKASAESEETRRVKNLQSKLDQMRDTFDKDQGQRAKDLEDQITQNKMELVSLVDSIKSNEEKQKLQETELRSSEAELKAVQDALFQIKNSIGG